MKWPMTFATGLLAIMAALALSACATSNTITDAESPTRMRPHSHVEEKTGVPQRVPDAMSDKPNAYYDRTKHFHPRDGK